VVVSPPRKRGDLCCFAQKASIRRHESTAIILVLRGNFACQQQVPLLTGDSSVQLTPMTPRRAMGDMKPPTSWLAVAEAVE
jgi:hypothetical protein